TGRLPTYGRAAIAIAVAFWLTVATFVGATLWRERQQALENASLTAETITALLAESTERTFQNVDLALQAVVHQLEMTPSAQRDDPGIRAAMRRHLDNSPYVRAIFVVDPDGFIVHHTEPQPQQASLADRDYFIVHRDDPSRLRAISEPIESRRGTGWFVAVTRRIGDGSTFRGVVVAAIRLAYFSDLYDRLGLGDGQSITLFHTDGRLIARHPPADDRIGQSYSDFPMFRDHLPQRPVGVYFSEGPPIPFRRLMSYRRLESRPLVVSSGHAESVILASWHRAATASGIGLLALAVFLGAAVWQFVRQQRQRERAAAQQRRTDEALALAEANAKFRTFFEQGSFFKILLSPEGVVLEANRMSLETTGFTRDDAIGRKFWECGWWNASPDIADSVRDAVAHGLR